MNIAVDMLMQKLRVNNYDDWMCATFQLIFVSVLVEELLYCLEVRAAPAPAMLIRARSLHVS